MHQDLRLNARQGTLQNELEFIVNFSLLFDYEIKISFFISTAHAAPAAAQGPSLMANILMIAVFVAIFYFLIWRPQAKRAKEHRSLVESLGVGSEIVFAGGLMGRITKIDGDFAVVELSRGVDVKIQRASVISVLPEGTLNNL